MLVFTAGFITWTGGLLVRAHGIWCWCCWGSWPLFKQGHEVIAFVTSTSSNITSVTIRTAVQFVRATYSLVLRRKKYIRYLIIELGKNQHALFTTASLARSPITGVFKADSHRVDIRWCKGRN